MSRLIVQHTCDTGGIIWNLIELDKNGSHYITRSFDKAMLTRIAYLYNKYSTPEYDIYRIVHTGVFANKTDQEIINDIALKRLES